MLKALKVKQAQGRQYIVDLRHAALRGFRGRPAIRDVPCASGCRACEPACPTGAIGLVPVTIDLGRCVFCAECTAVCPVEKLALTSEHRMASADRIGLIAYEGQGAPTPVAVSAALHARFGRSLKLRSVSAGGCNACELELAALGNVNFDLGRYGIELVASPRHADGLVLTGPLTRNMSEALELTYAAMPAPKIIIAVGACAISGGLFAESRTLDRGFVSRFEPSLYVPGCPVHPLTLIEGLLDLLGIELPGRAHGILATVAAARVENHEFPRQTVAARHDAAQKMQRALGCDLERSDPTRNKESHRG